MANGLAHRKDAAILRRYLAQQPALSRLALDAIPRFAERAGLDLKTEFEKVERFFANETANLILARILLIRFLEDHGFFDVTTADGPRRRRYLCNGGVAAFQGMRQYFEFGYSRLLEEAYRTGGHFYSAAFDETEMDWIIALSDVDLSRTVEWALFRMARFDFATAISWPVSTTGFSTASNARNKASIIPRPRLRGISSTGSSCPTLPIFLTRRVEAARS
jgi:hypothetical protein